MDPCRCDDASMLWGGAGDDYATSHLVRDRVAEGGGETVYRCPRTGVRWVGEFAADADGLVAFRLRRIMRAAELVEILAAADDPVAGLDWSDPDVEFRPTGSAETYRGVEAARRWAHRATEPGFPRAKAVQLIDVADDEVVVLGSVAFERDGRYSEHRPAAWLVTTREGRLLRSLWFDSWNAARKAAGVLEHASPPPRRIGPAILPLLRAYWAYRASWLASAAMRSMPPSTT